MLAPHGVGARAVHVEGQHPLLAAVQGTAAAAAAAAAAARPSLHADQRPAGADGTVETATSRLANVGRHVAGPARRRDKCAGLRCEFMFAIRTGLGGFSLRAIALQKVGEVLCLDLSAYKISYQVILLRSTT